MVNTDDWKLFLFLKLPGKWGVKKRKMEKIFFLSLSLSFSFQKWSPSQRPNIRITYSNSEIQVRILHYPVWTIFPREVKTRALRLQSIPWIWIALSLLLMLFLLLLSYCCKMYPAIALARHEEMMILRTFSSMMNRQIVFLVWYLDAYCFECHFITWRASS